MDRITESLVAKFCDEYGLQGASDSEKFEDFVNLSIVNAEYQESFDPGDVHVGSDSNIGIDGLAIIVNGALVVRLASVADNLPGSEPGAEGSHGLADDFEHRSGDWHGLPAAVWPSQ